MFEPISGVYAESPGKVSEAHPTPKYQMDLIMFCVQNTHCEWAFCECIKIIHLRP